MMPITMADIAEAAGVSAATVDRALNGRAGVRARTRERVHRAALRMGYADAPTQAADLQPREAPAAAARRVRLAFILPAGTTTFLRVLAAALRAASTAPGSIDRSGLDRGGLDVDVHVMDTFRPLAVAAELRRIAADVDGLGLVALDHPATREAVRELAARGLPVVTLVSDIADVPRAAYVGIDNRAAGRLAAHLIGRFLGGRGGGVALFAGSLAYRGHEEREMGFRRVCAEELPGLVVLPTVEVADESGLAYEAARRTLAERADLVAIYGIGGGVRGIVRAVAASGRHPVFIGHELSEHTRRFLIEGTMDAVLDQDPAAEARLAVEVLAAAARGQMPPGRLPMLRIHAIFRENIPDLAATTGGRT